MNNLWMISHDHKDWIENFLQESVTSEVEQFMFMFNESDKIEPLMSVDKKGIATISINGPLAPKSHALMTMFNGTSTIELNKAFQQTLHDPKIKGVLLLVDSPGGDTTMIDETADVIHQVAQIKPVLAQVTGANNSAALYLSSQATKIFAQNRTNRIGSIGTRLVIEDDSEALQKAGVKIIVIDTGDNKTIGEGKPVTPQQVSYLQEHVDTMQGFFEETVQRGRPGIDISQVNDGSVFLANVAKQKELIDGIDSLEATRARLEAMIAMR